MEYRLILEFNLVMNALYNCSCPYRLLIYLGDKVKAVVPPSFHRRHLQWLCQGGGEEVGTRAGWSTISTFLLQFSW
uniref:Uncharacterized protein n=1 Tax=Oryza brachyantha TaxID=4533 RepID=J3N7X0_ORYBR